MSAPLQEVLTSEEVVRPNLEVIVGGAGQVATSEVVEVPTYEYCVSYSDGGEIVSARSRRTNPAAGETICKEFDADGNLTYKDEVYQNGDLQIATWYKNGAPWGSAAIDRVANSHTMTIFQPGIGDWVCTTQYEGQDGWVGSAPTDIAY